MSRLLFAMLFAGTVAAQVQPSNAGFEQGPVGGVPTGWFVPQAIAGSGAEVVEQGCHVGSRCAMLRGTSTGEGPSSNLMQTATASGYNLRRIRMRAAIRVEGANSRAQMWLRLDRADNSMAFLENMSQRPIRSPEWKAYAIETDVPGDVSRLAYGVLLFGPGPVWVDDVTFEVVGEVIKDRTEPPRPLTEQGLTNLIAFTKLYGYVRHFHPSDEAARADWETFAVDGIRKVESAANTAGLIARLKEVFAPVAPTVQVFAPPDAPAAAAPSGPKLVRYTHTGVGLPTTTITLNVYRSERVTADTGDPPKPFEADLVPGVRAMVPLAVYADGTGTLPHAAPAQKLPIYERTGEDRGARLAGIVIAWNVFQHFYPHFDVVQTDWPAELSRGLRSAAADADGQAFETTLRRLVAALHDGHGRVGGPRAQSFSVPPVMMDFVENEFIVTRVRKGQAEGVSPGDRIVAIDGKAIGEAVPATRAGISAASDGWMRYRAAAELSRCRPGASKMTLELEPFVAKEKRTVELDCGAPKPKDPESYTEPRPAEKVAELEPGIVYVDLDRVDQKEFEAAIPRIEKAKGIIFDMRGYPGQPGIGALAHLTDSPIRSARWNIPAPTMPDRLDVPFLESGWPVPPQKPYFAAKRAFLIDGRAISYAETVMGIVEHFKLGEIVGEPTAGTNGNVNPFKLPGGYTISWTGMKVLKHDGSQHHGIGIRPTVPASRTRKGVAEGKDELLLKAIEVVKQ
jgi:C-terminal processing protease CtpA/Prc